jgi:hypothetical protein
VIRTKGLVRFIEADISDDITRRAVCQCNFRGSVRKECGLQAVNGLQAEKVVRRGVSLAAPEGFGTKANVHGTTRLQAATSQAGSPGVTSALRYRTYDPPYISFVRLCLWIFQPAVPKWEKSLTRRTLSRHRAHREAARVRRRGAGCAVGLLAGRLALRWGCRTERL